MSCNASENFQKNLSQNNYVSFKYFQKHDGMSLNYFTIFDHTKERRGTINPNWRFSTMASRGSLIKNTKMQKTAP